MLDFIDTNLFKKDVTINVIVYTNERERGIAKVKRLIEGENVIEHRENYHETRVIVERNGVKILIRTMPISHNTRGQRSQYALIDRSILGMEHGEEIFFCRISATNHVYSHLLENNEKKPSCNIILF